METLRTPEMVPRFLEDLRSGDIYERMFAAFGLGAMEDDSAAEPLIESLQSPRYPVVAAAAEALGRLGETREHLRP